MHRACLPIASLSSAILSAALLSSAVLAQSDSLPVPVTTQPATGPATSPATTAAARVPAEITPAGRALLDRIRKAYSIESPLAVEGTITGTFDVAGRQADRRMAVVGYANGSGRFSHDAPGVGRVVHTGERVYIYDSRQNAYGALTVPDKRQAAEDVSDDIIDILIDENPSLLLTLATDPDELLLHAAEKIDARADELILQTQDEVRTLRLNDQGLIQSMSIDYTPLLKRKGATEIKKALVELSYSRVERRAAPEGTFAFAIPAGSSEMQLADELMKERMDEMRRRIRTTTRPTTQATTRPTSGASPRPTTGAATGPITDR